MVDWNGAYLHPAYETHRKLKCTSPFCSRVENIATGVTDTCCMCSSDMIPIDEMKCPSCGRGMYNDNCLWCEDPEMVICPGRLDEKGKLRHVCKEDCSHSIPHEHHDACDVSNEPFCSSCIPKESKIEYKMKCRYCGDIQIVNEMSFEKIIENGCESECWGCGKQGYEPIIPEGLFVLSYENLIEAIQDHPFLEMVDGEPEKCWLCEGTGFVMKDRQTGAMFAKEPCIDWATKDCWEHQCPNCDDGPEPPPDIDVVKEGKYSSPDKSIYPLKCPKCKVVYDSDIVIIPNRCPSCGYEPLKDLADNVGVPPV